MRQRAASPRPSRVFGLYWGALGCVPAGNPGRATGASDSGAGARVCCAVALAALPAMLAAGRLADRPRRDGSSRRRWSPSPSRRACRRSRGSVRRLALPARARRDRRRACSTWPSTRDAAGIESQRGMRVMDGLHAAFSDRRPLRRRRPPVSCAGPAPSRRGSWRASAVSSPMRPSCEPGAASGAREPAQRRAASSEPARRRRGPRRSPSSSRAGSRGGARSSSSGRSDRARP